MVWNRRRAAALAACAWSRVTDGIPHDGADPRLRQERRLEALQDRMDWVGEREPEPVRGTRIAAGEQQRDRLYVPIDDQRSAVAAVAEGVRADALDLHLPVEPQVADVVVHHHQLPEARSSSSQPRMRRSISCCASPSVIGFAGGVVLCTPWRAASPRIAWLLAV